MAFCLLTITHGNMFSAYLCIQPLPPSDIAEIPLQTNELGVLVLKLSSFIQLFSSPHPLLSNARQEERDTADDWKGRRDW